MHDFGFFISLCIVGFAAYCLGGILDARRRRLRRMFVEKRREQSDRDFEVGISSLNPVPAGFSRDFRKAVGQALGVEAAKLDPQDRVLRDLRAYGFDAMELACALERTFDVRVKVIDVVRAGTLRKLAMLINERTLEISDFEPPLHREPIPKVTPPAPEVAGAVVVTPPPNENL
jgi:acyl carrier protein